MYVISPVLYRGRFPLTPVLAGNVGLDSGVSCRRALPRPTTGHAPGGGWGQVLPLAPQSQGPDLSLEASLHTEGDYQCHAWAEVRYLAPPSPRASHRCPPLPPPSGCSLLLWSPCPRFGPSSCTEFSPRSAAAGWAVKSPWSAGPSLPPPPSPSAGPRWPVPP
jgi:hypothetical protein